MGGRRVFDGPPQDSTGPVFVLNGGEVTLLASPPESLEPLLRVAATQTTAEGKMGAVVSALLAGFLVRMCDPDSIPTLLQVIDSGFHETQLTDLIGWIVDQYPTSDAVPAPAADGPRRGPELTDEQKALANKLIEQERHIRNFGKLGAL